MFERSFDVQYWFKIWTLGGNNIWTSFWRSNRTNIWTSVGDYVRTSVWRSMLVQNLNVGWEQYLDVFVTFKQDEYLNVGWGPCLNVLLMSNVCLKSERRVGTMLERLFDVQKRLDTWTSPWRTCWRPKRVGYLKVGLYFRPTGGLCTRSAVYAVNKLTYSSETFWLACSLVYIVNWSLHVGIIFHLDAPQIFCTIWVCPDK